MGAGFWIKRFVLALTVAGLLLFVVQQLKGYSLMDAALFAAIWGTLSAALFTLVGYRRYKRNPACMLPESR